jgi:hypothetical protein
MFITRVDSSFERLLRARLPLPAEVGDVVFDAPTANWSATLSRITVNLVLYDVQHSTMPSTTAQRGGADHAGMRRRPLPMMQLGYLVSAWAGSPRDEHQLLGDVVSILTGLDQMPAEFTDPELQSPIRFVLKEDPRNVSRDIWAAAGGQLKASVLLQAVTAADTFDWTAEPPAVERIQVLTAPHLAAIGRDR